MTAHTTRGPTSRLRVGVLGTGYWAWWCHGTALCRLKEVEMVGYWGRNSDNASKAVARTGGQAFENLQDLLHQVDVVSIALPPHVQPAVAARAAEAGKHILLDKPLALDLDDADLIVDAARHSGIHTLSMMTYLFQPEVIAWVDQLRHEAELHGPWESVAISLAGSIDTEDSPYAASQWRREHGGLWDWGPHALSLVDALLAPIEGVSATRGKRDLVNVALSHADGASSLLTLTVTAPSAAQHTTITVWGPAGRRSLDLPSGNLREAYIRAFQQLRESIATRVPHKLDAAYGRNIVAVLDTARRQL